MSDCCNKCGSITLFKGTNGDYVQVTPEPAGGNCPEGGLKVEIISGVDDTTVKDTQYVCNGEQGPQGIQGIQGPAGADGTNGTNGTDGVGISNIAWTSNSGGQPQGTQGTTDTYTITLTDASTYNFLVTNGADGAGSGGGAFGGLTLRIVDGLGDPEQAQGNLLGYLDTPYDPDLGRQTLIPNSIYYFKNIPSTVDKTLWIRLPFDGTYNGGVTPQRGDKIVVQADDQGFFDSDGYVAAGTEFLIGTQIPPLNSDPQIEVYIGRQGDPNGNPGVALENINSSYANPLDASRARYLIINRGTDHFNASSAVFNWMRWEFECIEDFSNDGRVIWQIVNTTLYSVLENPYAALEPTYYE